MAGVLCLLFCAAGAPTPLYGIYRAQLGFSVTTLTAELTALAYCVATAALVAVAAGGLVLRGHRPTAGQASDTPARASREGAPGPASDSPRPVREPPGLPRARVRAAGAAW
jgi:hypothetical protein